MPIYAGYFPQPGRWSSSVKLGGVNTPPIEYLVDPTLPSVGQDQNYPNRDFIVIPRSRLVSATPSTLTRLLPETQLTVSSGVDPLAAPSFAGGGNIPFGYAPFHIYRNFSGLPADRPLGVMHESIEVPYTTINESYNTSTNGGTRLVAGEWLMPYYGSKNTQAFTPKERGKLVRWVEKKVYMDTAAASAVIVLASAPFPAFLPRLLFAYNAAGGIVTSGATMAYSDSLQRWVATFTGAAQTVVYEYGASVNQRIGQVLGIEPVSTAGGINADNHDLSGWLKWVTDNFGAWDWPPIVNPHNFTSVTQEAVSISSTLHTGALANAFVIPTKPITVYVTGSVIDVTTGASTSLAGALSLADTLFFNDQSQGQYYDIDFLTGNITFAANVTVTTCKIDYFYETTFRDGMKYDSGIMGLSDGRDSGVIGLPPHLDVAGVLGALRVAILP